MYKIKHLIIYIIILCIFIHPINFISASEKEESEKKSAEILSLKDLSRQFVSIARKVSPSVVNISISKVIAGRNPRYFYFGPGQNPFDEMDPLQMKLLLNYLIRKNIKQKL